MVVTTLANQQVSKLSIDSINPFVLPSLPLTERSNLPSLPGIYFVISESNEVLYIGQSTNLMFRWHSTNHNKYRDFINLGNVRIAWLVVEEIDLLIIEGKLISIFRPPFNTAGKTHKSIREEFRFTEDLANKLRKYAYEKDLKKVDIVALALEEFFNSRGY